MRQKPTAFAVVVFVAIVAAGGAIGYAAFDAVTPASVVIAGAAIVVGWIAASAVESAAPWDRAIVLHLGHVRALRGPSIIPIDMRVNASAFKAEHTRRRPRSRTREREIASRGHRRFG
jgi:hypothetical protein